MSTQLAPPRAAPGGPPSSAPPEARYRSPHADAITAAVIAAVATTLSTLAVGSMLSGMRWLFQALGAVALVMVLGMALRAVRVPRPLVILAQTVACTFYVTAFYAASEGILGFLPGPDATGRLRDRVDAGITELNNATIPFTPGPDAALVTVIGVIATAIAVDALSAGYRRPLLAGAPLLTLYAIPAFTLPEGPRSWLFVLPALGLLLLFVGDDGDRLRRWGLLPDSWDLARTSARRTGLIIGMNVLVIALVVPAAIPKISAGLFDKQLFGLQTDPPITTLDPLVEMRRSLIRPADIPLLEVSSDTAVPDEQYLRAVTLDEFTGSQWRAGDRSIEPFGVDLPPVPGLSAGVPTSVVDSSIRGLPEFRTDYLPLPYPPTRLQIEGKWRVDPLTANVLSTDGREQAADRTYTVQSLDLELSRDLVGDALPDDPALQRYLELPEALPEQIDEVARRVAGGTNGRRDPLTAGLKLQRWLSKNFQYDLRTPQGSGGDAIVEFLNRKRGYCEQFASTMAVMARILGVPARVSVGYTAGEAPIGDTRVVSAWDAHAWPELWLPDIGWARFEPTPGNANSAPTIPSWLRDKEKKEKQEEQDERKDREPAEEKPPPPPPPPDIDLDGGSAPSDMSIGAVGAVPPQSVSDPDPEDSGSVQWLWLIAWFLLFWLLLLLLLAVPWALRERLRRRRWASVARASGPEGAAALAEVAWAELRDTAVDLGYAWPAARTPRQTAAVLVEDAWLGDRPTAALKEITGLVEQTRYSAGTGPAKDPAAIRTAVETVCHALAIMVDREARLRARVLPRSLRHSLFPPRRKDPGRKGSAEGRPGRLRRRRPDESPA